MLICYLFDMLINTNNYVIYHNLIYYITPLLYFAVAIVYFIWLNVISAKRFIIIFYMFLSTIICPYLCTIFIVFVFFLFTFISM